MSADKSNEQKALAPAGVEDKSLSPKATEDKSSPAPAQVESDDRVIVKVAHPVPAGRIGNDKDLAPGDELPVTKYLAKQLVQQGVARLV